MSSRSSKSSSPLSPSKRRPSSSKKTKTDDWSEVTEPEERRRIQNRIAQRKFREKAREQKAAAERDSRNQEHAGSSYRIPDPEDVVEEEELSGLPWGGPNLRYVVARGHETASQQGSRRASDQYVDDTQYLSPYVATYPPPPQPTTTSWDGRDSSGEDRYYDDSPYYFEYDTSGGNSTT